VFTPASREGGDYHTKKLRGDERHPSQELAVPQGHFFAFFFPFFFAAFFFFGMTPHPLSLWRSGSDVRSEDPPRRAARAGGKAAGTHRSQAETDAVVAAMDEVASSRCESERVIVAIISSVF
jgi:hypothetical protein